MLTPEEIVQARLAQERIDAELNKVADKRDVADAMPRFEAAVDALVKRLEAEDFKSCTVKICWSGRRKQKSPMAVLLIKQRSIYSDNSIYFSPTLRQIFQEKIESIHDLSAAESFAAKRQWLMPIEEFESVAFLNDCVWQLNNAILVS